MAAILLPLLQLVPLPPSLWSTLPGREPFLDAARVAGMPQPWRPIAISPDATLNALLSLLVPAAMLFLAIGLETRTRAQLPLFVFLLTIFSATIAVLQLSRAFGDNPFINETVGTATGIFANVNHQALLLAIGIVAGAAWVAERQHGASWRLALAGAATIWFLLMILASGSRTGLALGVLAIVLAAIIAWRPLHGRLRNAPIWLRWALLAAAVIVSVGLAVITVTAGRAVSIDRLLALSAGEDMRSRALPTVLDMVARYFPFGSGFGSFEALFRMHEPDALLKLTFFNHAHSDLVEIVLDGGLPAIILLVVALGWAARAGLPVWADRAGRAPARFGGAMLLLITLASLVDYPARTPMIMALIAIAAVLIAERHVPVSRDALRK
ncbi:O-antigen ligase [Sphingomonas sp. 8AM]|nr:O-antigen ligase [Sphingomonas sp. 8AM]